MMAATEALDRLYAAPLEQFVTLRRELAATLRERGELAASREVAAAKKPSRPAWALNQVARRHPEQLRGVVEAHAAAAAAQSSGDADAMRTARAFRDLLAGVVKSCAAVLSDAGTGMTPSQARQISETLRAAAADPSTRARLLAGVLTENVETDDPFAGVEAAAPSSEAHPPHASDDGAARASLEAREREEARAREARARALEEAQRRVDALEAEVRQARSIAHDAEIAANRARSDAERARRAAEDLEERLAQAQRELKAL
jgi:hypothetical protein